MALEFARVNWPTRVQISDYGSESGEARIKALVAFAAQYGALCSEQSQGDSSTHSLIDLHSTEWALMHAAALDTVLTLNGALATGQVDLVDRQFEAMGTYARIGNEIAGPAGLGYAPLHLDLPPSDLRKERVQWVTEKLLNPNMGGTRLLRNGREYVVFGALYELLHSQMAEWIARANFGQCDGCGGFFPRNDGRQKYCPALLDQKESRCAMRDRSRRRRGSGGETPLRRRPKELLLRQNAMTDVEVSFEMKSLDKGSSGPA